MEYRRFEGFDAVEMEAEAEIIWDFAEIDLLFEHDADWADDVGFVSEAFTSMWVELKGACHKRELPFPADKVVLVSLCHDAVVERHQHTANVSRMNAGACKASATLVLEWATVDESLSKVQCKFDRASKAREAVEKDLFELQSVFADVGCLDASVLERARLSLAYAVFHSSSLSALKAELAKMR